MIDLPQLIDMVQYLKLFLPIIQWAVEIYLRNTYPMRPNNGTL